MPTNDRVGLHDNENFFPTRPEARERDPEGTVKRRESGLRSRLRIGCELLAQSKLDDRLLISTSEEGERAAEKCCRETEQGPHQGEILRDLSAETARRLA